MLLVFTEVGALNLLDKDKRIPILTPATRKIKAPAPVRKYSRHFPHFDFTNYTYERNRNMENVRNIYVHIFVRNIYVLGHLCKE